MPRVRPEMRILCRLYGYEMYTRDAGPRRILAYASSSRGVAARFVGVAWRRILGGFDYYYYVKFVWIYAFACERLFSRLQRLYMSEFQLTSNRKTLIDIHTFHTGLAASSKERIKKA